MASVDPAVTLPEGPAVLEFTPVLEPAGCGRMPTTPGASRPGSLPHVFHTGTRYQLHPAGREPMRRARQTEMPAATAIQDDPVGGS